MRLSTKVINTVEMSQNEFDNFWKLWRSRPVYVDDVKIVHWDTDDGNNSILLDGEDRYRAVVIVSSDEITREHIERARFEAHLGWAVEAMKDWPKWKRDVMAEVLGLLNPEQE